MYPPFSSRQEDCDNGQANPVFGCILPVCRLTDPSCCDHLIFRDPCTTTLFQVPNGSKYCLPENSPFIPIEPANVTLWCDVSLTLRFEITAVVSYD